MHIPMGDRIDALCQRQCAFALYCLPGESQPVFCMAENGRTEEDFTVASGVCSLLTVTSLIVFCVMAIIVA